MNILCGSMLNLILTIEIYSTGAISINFGDHFIQFIFRNVIVKGSQNVAKVGNIDVTISLKIKQIAFRVQ